MKKQSVPDTIQPILPKKEEKLLKRKLSGKLSGLTEAELLKLKQESDVQSIELELQNEELKLSNSAAQSALQFYDIVQAGYIILSAKGKIVDLWLSTVNLPAKVYSVLKDKQFASYVTEDTRPVFSLFLKDLFTRKVKASCEITLIDGSNLPKYVFLAGTLENNETQCIVAVFDISRRKQAEASAIATGIRYQTLLETASDGIHILDEKGNVIEANATFCKMLGYTHEELVKLNVADWEMQWTGEELLDKVKKVIVSPAVQQTQHRRKDGSICDVEISGVGVKLEGHDYLHASARDITGRKKAESELHRIMSLNNATLESIHNGILVVNHEGKVLKTNARFAQMWHIPQEIINSGNDNKLLRYIIGQLDDPDAFMARVNELYSKPEAESIDLINFKDGRIFERISKPVYLEGKTEGRVWSFLDITEHKRGEKALLESEARFRNMADTAPVLIWVAGPDGRCTYINRPWLDFTGRTVEQELGNGWLERVHPEDAESMFRIFHNSLKSRVKYSMEYRMRHFDGNYRWMLEYGIPRYTSDGIFVGYIGTCVDISESKQAREEIKLMNVELEYRVKQRTQQLENANKELEKFSYSVAHNLRSPLRGIDGWSLALMEEYYEKLDEQGRSYLARVRSEAQLMGNLIDDLLRLAHITRQEMKQVTIDLTALVNDIINQLKKNYPQRKIEFSVQPGLCIQGDPSLLGIVLTNLIDNACKFTGLVPLARIEFGKLESDGKDTFFIRDNGVGFDMNYTKKIFGAFLRMHRAADFPGAGIGLAIVHLIISRHGGRIWAESKQGEGSTFYFTVADNV
jgi:PAS domain S-box-containing protein